MQEELEYGYRGARALIALHETELLAFRKCWQEAHQMGLQVPTGSADPDYATLDHIAFHVYGAARNYLVWICRKLEVTFPQITPLASFENVSKVSDEWLIELADAYRTALHKIPEDDFEKVFDSNWKIPYCIDAMLEHAVMHPMRHRFQLAEWIKNSSLAE